MTICALFLFCDFLMQSLLPPKIPPLRGPTDSLEGPWFLVRDLGAHSLAKLLSHQFFQDGSDPSAFFCSALNGCIFARITSSGCDGMQSFCLFEFGHKLYVVFYLFCEQKYFDCCPRFIVRYLNWGNALSHPWPCQRLSERNRFGTHCMRTTRPFSAPSLTAS